MTFEECAMRRHSSLLERVLGPGVLFFIICSRGPCTHAEEERGELRPPEEFSASMERKAFPVGVRLGAGSASITFNPPLHRSNDMSFQVRADHTWIPHLSKFDYYEVRYVCPEGKIVPMLGGLYRVTESPRNTLVGKLMTDPELLGRAGIQPRSYVVVKGSYTTIAHDDLSIGRIGKDAESGKAFAEIVVNATSEERKGTAAPPPERTLTVREGETIQLPRKATSDIITPIPFGVLRIVLPERSPTGLIGWVELGRSDQA
jgi:hypothetical protein